MNYVWAAAEMVAENELLYDVMVRPQTPGVQLPEDLMSQDFVRLSLGEGLARPPKVEMHEEGIEAVLSFNMRSFSCYIPWPALAAIIYGPDMDDVMSFSKMGAVGTTRGEERPTPTQAETTQKLSGPKKPKGKLRLV